MDVLILYLFIVNAAAFLFMLADKQKARRKAWRIPETTLLGVAAIGGSLGAILAMHIFRHKTRHPKFSFGLPLLLLLQITVFCLLFRK